MPIRSDVHTFTNLRMQLYNYDVVMNSKGHMPNKHPTVMPLAEARKMQTRVEDMAICSGVNTGGGSPNLVH